MIRQTTVFGGAASEMTERQAEMLHRLAHSGLMMGEMALSTLSRVLQGAMDEAESTGDDDALRIMGSGSGHVTTFLQFISPAIEAATSVHTATNLDPRGTPDKDEQQRVAAAVEDVSVFVEAIINIACRLEIAGPSHDTLCKAMDCKPHHVDKLTRQVAKGVAERFNVKLTPPVTTYGGKRH